VIEEVEREGDVDRPVLAMTRESWERPGTSTFRQREKECSKSELLKSNGTAFIPIVPTVAEIQSRRAVSEGEPSCRGPKDETAPRIDTRDGSDRAVCASAGGVPGKSARRSISRNAAVMRIEA
jgi:hypothetical protein